MIFDYVDKFYWHAQIIICVGNLRHNNNVIYYVFYFMGYKWFVIIVLVATTMLSGGCSSSRNTATTRNYQALITRYNIHYNGDKHYRETLEDMERNYNDDFSRILLVHPAEARAIPYVEQPAGDFSRSIEKAQKAIQLRSIKKRPAGPSSTPQQREWKRRSEYNPFLHNSWLMLGKAEYMNGDFALAANTFLYISAHFKWLPETVAEARLWEALCHCALDRLYEAESILAKISQKQLNNKELRCLFLTASVSLQLRRQDYSSAVKYLPELIELSHGKQKTRLRYLLGQALEKCGNKDEAYQVFKKIENSLTIDYMTRFYARMSMSMVIPATETDREINSLEKMTRYGSNADYLDKIYYTIGKLYITKKDTISAIQAFEKAVYKSTRVGFDKAVSQLALAGLYYNQGKYNLARDCYDAAIPLISQDYAGLDSIQKRAIVIGEIGGYYDNVLLQDSLLSLSRMSREQQIVIARLLANKYKESHRIDNDISGYISTSIPDLTERNVTVQPSIFTMSQQDASWYFYNPTLVRVGREQFRKIWGDRPLADDWRRSSRNLLSESSDNTNAYDYIDDDHAEDTGTLSTIDISPDNPAYYLATIPYSPKKISDAEISIEDGLYNIGLILRNRLDDYIAAEREWSKLLLRFPNSRHKLEVCENLYFIYARGNHWDKAEEMRQMILNDYPDTPLAHEMSQAGYIERKKAMLDSQQLLYDRVYTAYLGNENTIVHELCDSVDAANTSIEIIPKLKFLNALAYGADGNTDRFTKEIRELAEMYPDADIAHITEGMIKYLDAGRSVTEGSRENVRPLIKNTQFDDTFYNHEETDVTINLDSLFTFNHDSNHMLLLTYDPDLINSNTLLYNVARHNFNAFAVRDFDLKRMTIGNVSMLVISAFSSLREAEYYISLLYRDAPEVLPPGVQPIIISNNNLDVLMRYNLSISDYLKAVETIRYRDAQVHILNPSVYEIEELEF